MSDARQVAPTIRAVTLYCFMEAARFVGLDPYEMLRRFDIAPDLLKDPENRLPARSAMQLIEASATESGCASFGLLLAQCRDFASLGPVSLLLRHLEDMRAILATVIEYQRSFNDLLHMSLVVDGEEAMLRYDFREEFASTQIVEVSVAIAYRVLREVSEGRWYPECVRFRHAAPADTRRHQLFFKCRLEFDSDSDGLAFDAHLLDLPNPHANETLAAHARMLFGMLAPPHAVSISDRTRSAMRMLIPGGDVTLERVADNLALQPRSLQRLLEKEKSAFGKLLNDTRRELALRSLGESRQSITEISEQLGYACVTSFTRWFTREFGHSPRAWRIRQSAEQGSAMRHRPPER